MRYIAFFLLICYATYANAKVFKCTAADGSVSYTDSPCSKQATSERIPDWWLKANQMQIAPDTEKANEDKSDQVSQWIHSIGDSIQEEVNDWRQPDTVLTNEDLKKTDKPHHNQ